MQDTKIYCNEIHENTVQYKTSRKDRQYRTGRICITKQNFLLKTRLVLSFSIGKHAFVESEIVKLIIIPQNSNQPLNHQTGPSLSTRMTMTRLARLKSTDNGIFPLLIDGRVFPLNWLYCLKHFVSTYRCNSGLVVFLLQSVIYNYCWGLCSPKRILTQKGFRFRPDAFTQLYIDSIYAERCTERQIKIEFTFFIFKQGISGKFKTFP